jgi:hypothetical protein
MANSPNLLPTFLLFDLKPLYAPFITICCNFEGLKIYFSIGLSFRYGYGEHRALEFTSTWHSGFAAADFGIRWGRNGNAGIAAA